MDLNKISAFVALLLALSVASERLVEITKGLIPYLNAGDPKAWKEPQRRAALHFLAMIFGILVAVFAGPAIPKEVLQAPRVPFALVALGLLASGGSGLWNSVLTYFERVQEVKKELLESVGELSGENEKRESTAPQPQIRRAEAAEKNAA